MATSLHEYNLKLIRRSGKHQQALDVMFRLSQEPDRQKAKAIDDVPTFDIASRDGTPTLEIMVEHRPISTPTLAALRDAQAEDLYCSDLRKILGKNRAELLANKVFSVAKHQFMGHCKWLYLPSSARRFFITRTNPNYLDFAKVKRFIKPHCKTISGLTCLSKFRSAGAIVCRVEDTNHLKIKKQTLPLFPLSRLLAFTTIDILGPISRTKTTGSIICPEEPRC